MRPISSLHGVHALARAIGGHRVFIPPEAIKPFLDIEKERNRLSALRTWAAPLGAVAMHLNLLPASYVAPAAAATGQESVSPAAAVLENIGMNEPWAAAPGSDFGSTIAGHMGPIFILGSLGALGGIGAAYGIGKLWRYLAARKAKRKLQETPFQNPILGM